VTLCTPNAVLYVHGLPDTQLVHLRFEGHSIVIEDELYAWMRLRNESSHALTVQRSHDGIIKSVIMQALGAACKSPPSVV